MSAGAGGAAEPAPLGTGAKLAYGVGQVAEGIKNAAFASILLFFYSQVLGLPASLAGTALLIATVLDAVTDPLLGSLSDSLRTRWGRRHPLLYASALPLGAAFAAVFSPPPGLGQSGLFAWLLGSAVATRAAMTLFHVPHLALGAELSRDYTERTVVVGYRVFFGFLGAVLFFFVSGEVFFRGSEALPDGQLDPGAYPGMGLFFGVVMVAVVLLTAAGTHARIPQLHVPDHGEPFSPARLLREMRGALANRSFRFFFAAVLVVLVARGVADATGIYMGTYFWELETRHIFRITALSLSGILVGVPIFMRLQPRFEKRTLFLVSGMGYGAIAGLAPVFKLIGWFPASDSAVYVPLLYAVGFAAPLFVAGAVLVPGSMLADIADEHELKSGRRQEGIFFGAISFSGKAASGLGSGLAGVVLDLIRFPVQAAPEDAPWAAAVRLALIAGPGVLAVSAVGVWLVSFYDLDRSRHARIRAALDARRQSTGSSTTTGMVRPARS